MCKHPLHISSFCPRLHLCIVFQVTLQGVLLKHLGDLSVLLGSVCHKVEFRVRPKVSQYRDFTPVQVAFLICRVAQQKTLGLKVTSKMCFMDRYTLFTNGSFDYISLVLASCILVKTKILCLQCEIVKCLGLIQTSFTSNVKTLNIYRKTDTLGCVDRDS